MASGPGAKGRTSADRMSEAARKAGARQPAASSPLQGDDLRFELLGAPPGLGVPELLVALRDMPLIGVGLPRVLPLLPGLGLPLALLLPLHLGPDADESARATTHVLQALPRTPASPTELRPLPDKP